MNQTFKYLKLLITHNLQVLINKIFFFFYTKYYDPWRMKRWLRKYPNKTAGDYHASMMNFTPEYMLGLDIFIIISRLSQLLSLDEKRNRDIVGYFHPSYISGFTADRMTLFWFDRVLNLQTCGDVFDALIYLEVITEARLKMVLGGRALQPSFQAICS